MGENFGNSDQKISTMSNEGIKIHHFQLSIKLYESFFYLFDTNSDCKDFAVQYSPSMVKTIVRRASKVICFLSSIKIKAFSDLK